MAQPRRRPKQANRSNGRDGAARRNPVHRRQETKVWHDPLIAPAGRKAPAAPAPEPAAVPDDEALHRRRIAPVRRAGARIICGPAGDHDPAEAERERLLHRLLSAEGRPSITRAAQAYLEGGFTLPRSQEVWLQLLEHLDEAIVVQAIEQLGAILDDEPLHRRAVLESRLRSIEALAEETATKQAASELRRLLGSRHAEPADARSA
jgi:hypothetical protein